MKWGQTPFARKWCQTWLALCTLLSAASAHTADPILFADDFESNATSQHPGAPWSEATFNTGVRIVVDSMQAHSGRQSLHVFTPRGANYRRGYVAIHLKTPVPRAMSAMYGRAMVFLEEAPIALPGAPPVHWTLLQGEGRSADDRYNSIYRLGVEGSAGLELMANFETTPPVTTDCKRKSQHLPPFADTLRHAAGHHVDGDRREVLSGSAWYCAWAVVLEACGLLFFRSSS